MPRRRAASFLSGRLPQNALDVLLLEALDRLAQIIHQGRIALDRSEVRRQIGRA